ncbi:MAG: hydrogenase expression/formation protein HypE [Burkholderiales bacterium]|nr:hydrogenase expression/formation protein HypE [Burkholderiales bacterium]
MNRTPPLDFTATCPVQAAPGDRVRLAHGGGGALMHRLIERLFLPAFANPALEARHDGAVLEVDAGRIAFTTDTFVVRPLFFPGGDIGSLAVNGTVNDLAMCGARPLWLSAGFVLEEGFPLADLERIVRSMREAAAAAGVALVTGDTKVVEAGKGDGVFVNTAGIGRVETALEIAPRAVRPGDAVIVSGDIGRHGLAVLAAREEIAFATTLESDCAPLARPVLAMLEAGIEVHCLRDLTRGGLAAALIEIAEAAGVAIELDEAAIPVSEPVRGASELLGLDPLYIANEGRFVAILPESEAERAQAVLARAGCAEAARIGRVQACAGGVTLRTVIGSRRPLDLPSGEQLPRIC